MGPGHMFDLLNSQSIAPERSIDCRSMWHVMELDENNEISQRFVCEL